MKNIVLPDNKERSLAFYLAMEEFVARSVEDEAFFVWRVAPTVIIGRNQDLEAEVNMDYCRQHDVKVVRRKSGGGCVYSDMGNIMISFVSRRGDVAEIFDKYLTSLTLCLRSLGLSAEKTGRNDILVEGRKVSGNAFHQMPDRSVVHGTLLYDTDFEALEKAIRPPVEKLVRHGVASVRQRVENLRTYLDPYKIDSVETLQRYLVEYFCDGTIALSETDVRNIEENSYEYEIPVGQYVIGIGEALWDCLPEGRKIGGAPANFAYHAGQFGFRSLAISAIGDDQLGREIKEKFDQRGLDYRLETVPYPTGTVQVTLDEKGIPCYEIKENVAWDNIPYSSALEELAKNCKAVCFGSLAQRNEVSRETINRFLDAMPDSDDTYKIFDINLRQHFYCKETIENSFGKCNVLKINDEELVVVSEMFGCQGLSQEEACKKLLKDYGFRMLILTCGTDGSYVFSADEVSFQNTPKVEVADTVGAGDSFTGSFIASILRGKTIPEAHKRAVEVSAFVCTQKGAMPVLPEDMTN